MTLPSTTDELLAGNLIRRRDERVVYIEPSPPSAACSDCAGPLLTVGIQVTGIPGRCYEWAMDCVRCGAAWFVVTR